MQGMWSSRVGRVDSLAPSSPAIYQYQEDSSSFARSPYVFLPPFSGRKIWEIVRQLADRLHGSLEEKGRWKSGRRRRRRIEPSSKGRQFADTLAKKPTIGFIAIYLLKRLA